MNGALGVALEVVLAPGLGLALGLALALALDGGGVGLEPAGVHAESASAISKALGRSMGRRYHPMGPAASAVTGT